MFKSHRIGPKGQEYFSLFISASLALADILLGMVVVPFSLVQVCSISMKKIVKRLGLGLGMGLGIENRESKQSQC